MVIFLSGTVWAASNVTFVWDANTEPDLAGYRLYQSATPGVYEDPAIKQIPGTDTETTVQVEDGLYFFVLTAYDQSDNESGPSNEVSVNEDTTPPLSPGLTITIIIKIDVD